MCSARPSRQPPADQTLVKKNFICLPGPTDVKVSILIRSMGPISDIDMVNNYFSKYFYVLISDIQHYSMDCYFRQYWRDTRLSFKGLKMNSNQLHINQLSLNVKMLGTSDHSRSHKIWTPRHSISGPYLEIAAFCQMTSLRTLAQKRSGSLTLTSTTGWTPTSTPSPDLTSSSGSQRTETSPTPWGAVTRFCNKILI